MRRIVPCVLVLVASVPVGGAPAPLPKPERPDRRPDLERLQGKWELVRAVDHGGRVRALEPGAFVLVITGQRGRLECDGKEVEKEAFWITIDPSSTPKKMDLAPHSDQVPAEVKEAITARCIYRIQGNTLTIRMGFERPTDFTSPMKLYPTQSEVWILQRK